MKERTRSTYSIYSLMNDIVMFKVYILCAIKAYKKGARYYRSYYRRAQAEATLDILVAVNYITDTEYTELNRQLSHIFDLYKKH